jgi:hypothetical protein
MKPCKGCRYLRQAIAWLWRRVFPPKIHYEKVFYKNMNTAIVEYTAQPSENDE